jgi:hypothetical protein
MARGAGRCPFISHTGGGIRRSMPAAYELVAACLLRRSRAHLIPAHLSAARDGLVVRRHVIVDARVARWAAGRMPRESAPAKPFAALLAWRAEDAPQERRQSGKYHGAQQMGVRPGQFESIGGPNREREAQQAEDTSVDAAIKKLPCRHRRRAYLLGVSPAVRGVT